METRLAPATFPGGVAVAAADFNRDGFIDIATGARLGGGPHVKVLSGRDGSLLHSFMAYDPAFRGGVSVAAADINGDGFPDIITGAGPGGGPHVKVFNGRDASLLFSLFAYDPAFRGGVFVAGGDVNGDGRSDLITGAAANGGPHVKVFNGTPVADAPGSPAELDSFMAFDPAFGGGVTVAAADINRDGFADIITGAGPGGGPHVKVFNRRGGSLLQNFMAYAPAFTGGVHVAAGDVNKDNVPDVVTGAGPGGGPHVKVFSGTDSSLLQHFMAFDVGFPGGVFVATGDLSADGFADLIMGAGPGGGPHVRAVSGQDGANLASFFVFEPVSVMGGFSALLNPNLNPPTTPFTAPALDLTVPTTMSDASSFLYTGANPIQTGVAAGTIDPVRVAVVRGVVKERNGGSLAGVTVSILNHAEFGSTVTRVGGTFDMAVNGGGLLTVKYVKTGFLQVQRQVDVPWQDYTLLPDVVLTPLDSQVTTINLTLATPIQVARGSVVTDSDGTRRATLLFQQGTTATLTLPGGGTQPISTLNVRATEYTVGATGPQAMPGDLPEASGYTYAAEYSVDEAIAAGATRVQFSQPVFTYTENFLNFPVGLAVPVGYYDQALGQWIGEPNGRVVRILSITGGRADLDIDGSGTPANAAALAALGVTDAEREQLAALYPVNQSLWRTPTTHFSRPDHNWPYVAPPDARQPDPPKPPKECPCHDGATAAGSIVGIMDQTLGEALPVAGTPFQLGYQSDRTPGRVANRTLEIALSGASVPASLVRIQLTVFVAGQFFQQSFGPAPNQTFVYTWNGRDAYGRLVQGQQTATVVLGYVYGAVYATPAQFNTSWAGFAGTPLFTNPARQEITLYQESKMKIGGWNQQLAGLGGWNLNVHHNYNPTGRILFLGDGSQRRAEDLNVQVISTIAGTGVFGFSGDGGPATQAQISAGYNAIAPDGSIYLATFNRIRRIDPQGVITTIAGTGVAGFSGDGGPALAAQLNDPRSLAVAPDGGIIFSDTGNNRVRRIGPDGIISTIAGTGVAGFSGDGGPAILAQFGLAAGGSVLVRAGPDGTIYLVDFNNQRIRRIGTDGIINTVAGTGVAGFSGDGGPAVLAQLNVPTDVVIARDGSLWIGDAANNRVRRVGTDGIITTVAGTGVAGSTGDGGPATAAQVDFTSGFPFFGVEFALTPDGSLYLTERGRNHIRRIGPDGIITTVVGNGTAGFSGDGGPALQARLSTQVNDLDVGPDGRLYISDTNNRRIRRVELPLPGFTASAYTIPSADGSELYQFDAQGRHLRTLDALTGNVRFQFAYDAAGRLTTITDVDGNVTTITRNAQGMVIVAPFGQTTTLTIGADGYFSSIIDPIGAATRFTYTSGLMTTLTDPRNNVHTFTYDVTGRLIRDTAPDGSFTNLTRTEQVDGFTIAAADALGRTTTYRSQDLSTGVHRYTVTDSAGLQTVTQIGTNGTTTTTSPDGTVTTTTLGPDPRFKMQAPLTVSSTTTTPGGLISTSSQTRTVTLSNPNDPLSLTAQTDTVTLNGRTFTTGYVAATRTISSTSAAGRTSSAVLDARGHVVSSQTPNVTIVSYAYDPQGRLTSLTQGARTLTFTYDVQGNVATITDPLARITRFTYDAVGRVTQQTLPDGQVIGFTYDVAGNVTGITPPQKPAHAFTFNTVDLPTSYVPPNVGAGTNSTQYTYNLAKEVTRSTRPDGATIDVGYDTAGRLSTLTIARGTVSRTYSAVTGNLTGITAPDGGTLTLAYDGSLVTGITWAGAVAGSIQYVYDTSGRITSESVNGANTIAFTYDTDSVLTGAGAMTLTSDPANGFLTGTTLGNVTDTHGYSNFGERANYDARYSGASIYTVADVRDSLGRITQRTETIGGVTTVYGFAYDLQGRLTQVQRNSVVVGTYTYDANGNRLSFTGGSTQNGAYDNQDRLLTYGTLTYTYTANGELASKFDSSTGQTTTYVYDALGNLMRATLPSGTVIDYIIDGANHRIGKRVNGTLVQGFLYSGALGPAAELDGANAVVSRFVYATHVNVPDFMIRGGVTYRILTDQLGSVRLVVDVATGTVAQRLDYDEFGNVTTDTNPGFQPFGFAGGLYDRDTRLTRFGARDYDAQTGRWTAKDPIGFGAGQPNLFLYVGNDPINLIDQWGLKPSPPLDPRKLGPEEAEHGSLVTQTNTQLKNLQDVRDRLRPYKEKRKDVEKGKCKFSKNEEENFARLLDEELLIYARIQQIRRIYEGYSGPAMDSDTFFQNVPKEVFATNVDLMALSTREYWRGNVPAGNEAWALRWGR